MKVDSDGETLAVAAGETKCGVVEGVLMVVTCARNRESLGTISGWQGRGPSSSQGWGG